MPELTDQQRRIGAAIEAHVQGRAGRQALAPRGQAEPSPRRGQTPEGRVKAAIRTRLHAVFGGRLLLWNNAVGMVRTERGPFTYGLAIGSSDLIGVLQVDGRGLFVALEVKAPRGELTEVQESFLRRVQSVGGIAAVVRSADEAVAVLQAAGG